MRIRFILYVILFFIISCQSKKADAVDSQSASNAGLNTATSDIDNQKENGRWKCDEEICLQLRNVDSVKNTFEIFMINSVPIFGFQCDLPGIDILSSSGGLLEENEYQTSNSPSRLLSFSMQAKPIPVGMGVLTRVSYENPLDELCMTKIIFAGIGGSKLKNNLPDCVKLN